MIVTGTSLSYVSRKRGKPIESAVRSRGNPVHSVSRRTRHIEQPAPQVESMRDLRLREREAVAWRSILVEFDVLVSSLGKTEYEEWARAQISVLAASLRTQDRPRLKKGLYALSQAEEIVKGIKKKGG